KMLYDNALLLSTYAGWHVATGTALAEDVVDATVDFLLEELVTDEGGLASSLDADSEGVEGRYYVWTPAELVDVLGQQDGPWAAQLLKVGEPGTFENDSSTLQFPVDPPADELPRWFLVRDRLLAAREQRTRPDRDDKVVASWNGLAIAGLVRVALVFDEQRLDTHELCLDAAERIGELLWSLHWQPEDPDGGRLRRASRHGVV